MIINSKRLDDYDSRVDSQADTDECHSRQCPHDGDGPRPVASHYHGYVVMGCYVSSFFVNSQAAFIWGKIEVEKKLSRTSEARQTMALDQKLKLRKDERVFFWLAKLY
jgi:hypothetical protein